MTRTDPNNLPEDEVPEPLRAAFARLDGAAASIPPAIDQAILREAKSAFLRRRRFWRVARLGTGAAAAAALIAIAIRLFIVAPAFNRSVALNQHPALNQLADVNHDGRVDILDAYFLAQKIKRHEPLDPSWDLNGDGIVDQKDVDLIAQLAVQTNAEGK